MPAPPEQFAIGTGQRDGATGLKPTPARLDHGPVIPRNVIPFAKPRALAAQPATFQPVHHVPRNLPAPAPMPARPRPQLATPVGAHGPHPAAPAMAMAPHAATVIAPAPASLPPAMPMPAPAMPATRPAPAMPGPAMPAPAAPRFDPAVKTTPTFETHAPLPARWAPFEKLGLGLDPKRLQKHTVTAYRLLGFGILTIIVAILIGYIAQTTFFYLSSSWIVPMAVSATDDKVLAAQEQLAGQQNNRDKIAADLADAERAIGVQQAFQAEYTKTIKSDLSDARVALQRMKALAIQAASTREHIKATNNEFAASSAQKMAEEYRAGLIDRHEMLNGKYQLAQVSNSNLSLAERQADYEVKATDLDSQARSLEALLENQSAGVPLSYEVLKIKQEFEMSKLLMQKSVDLRDALKASVEREDKLIVTLKNSSYLRALYDHAQAAFVPYDNLKGVKKDSPVYACKLTMLFCHKAGRVLDVLQGEVQFKHPQRDKMLRGQMVELQLEDGAATNDVLFVGGRPLLF